MRVLVVHNRYRAALPSGENRVVDQEIAALRAAGHHVSTYIRSSDELATMPTSRKLRLATAPISSPSAARDVGRLIVAERPDVLHLHNPYPLISMSVVRTARKLGVPVVQTVHNHRHTCMKGTYQRDGHDCRDCLRAGHPLPGVRHACYRDSRLQSAVMAAALVRNRSLLNLVDQFVALTPEIRDSLLAGGFDGSRIVVKPNSVPDPGDPAPPGQGVAFVGRLSQEKGILALVDAWTRQPPGRGTLRIVGDGPARAEVEATAAGRPDVEVLGRLDAAAVQGVLASSGLVVVPSLWPEAFPLVLLEAMAAGRALLVTDQGGLPSVVDEQIGLVVPATADGIAEGLDGLATDHDRLRRLGASARARYLDLYHPDAVTARLVAVYEAVQRGGAG